MKACIFDLDGTLTDTLDSLEYSVNETMKQIHMPQITKEQCRDFVGNGAKVLIEKALKAGGDEALDRLDEAMEVYGRLGSFGRRPRQRKRLFAVFLKPWFFFVLSLCIF